MNVSREGVYVAAFGGRESPIKNICCGGSTSLIIYVTSIDLFASTNECVYVGVYVAAFGGRESLIKNICWGWSTSLILYVTSTLEL